MTRRNGPTDLPSDSGTSQYQKAYIALAHHPYFFLFSPVPSGPAWSSRPMTLPIYAWSPSSRTSAPRDDALCGSAWAPCWSSSPPSASPCLTFSAQIIRSGGWGVWLCEEKESDFLFVVYLPVMLLTNGLKERSHIFCCLSFLIFDFCKVVWCGQNKRGSWSNSDRW